MNYKLRQLLTFLTLLCTCLAAFRLYVAEYKDRHDHAIIARWARGEYGSERSSVAGGFTMNSRWLVKSTSNGKAFYIGRVQLEPHNVNGQWVWTEQAGRRSRDGGRYFAVPTGKWHSSIESAIKATKKQQHVPFDTLVLE